MALLQRCCSSVLKKRCSKLFHFQQRFLIQQTNNFRNEFVSHGYIESIPIFNDVEISSFNDEILKIEECIGPFVPQELNPHLKFESLYNIATHDKLLNIISSVFPDGFALFASAIFCKYPEGKNTRKYIGMHQDAYWNLEPNAMSSALTVFIAFDETTIDNGCLYVLPNSHKDNIGNIEHIYVDIDNNALLDGHEVDIQNNDIIKSLNETLKPILLKKGCASIHDARLIHGSYGNTTSNQRRLGFVVRFMDLNTKVGEWKYKNPIISEWRIPILIDGIPKTDQYYFKKPIFKELNEKQPPSTEQWKVRQHFPHNSAP